MEISVCVAEREQIGRALRVLRELHGLTETAFASRFHFSQSKVAKIENGQQNLSASVLLHIVRTFGISLDTFLTLPELPPDLRPWLLAGARMTPAWRQALLEVSQQWEQATHRSPPST